MIPTGHTDYVSPADKYETRYRDGERLHIRPARMLTGDPHTPETPGVAILTGRDHLIACLTFEHAANLADLLTDFIGSHPSQEDE